MFGLETGSIVNGLKSLELSIMIISSQQLLNMIKDASLKIYLLKNKVFWRDVKFSFNLWFHI